MIKASEERKKLEDKKNEQIKKEREEKQKQEQANNSSNSDSSPESGSTNLKTAAKNIIIGDFRTVGMCASITCDWTNCQFNNGGAFVTGDDIYIAQGSTGYSWFNSKAVSAVNDIIASNPDTTFNT